MTVEFIGVIVPRPETGGGSTAAVDREFVRELAQANEDAGFDRVLIGSSSVSPEGSQIAAYAAAHTERLTYLVAHRPGFRAPTVAARELATLDHFSAGRLAVHIITGGRDAELRRDGDFLAKDERYERTDEYLTILERAWTSSEPFDFHGRFYQLEGYPVAVRPYQQPRIPIYFGGSSESAYHVGAKHADVYALFAEPLAETAEQIASIHAASANSGRTEPPQVSVSVRVVLGASEKLAWQRAEEILTQTKAKISTSAGSKAHQNYAQKSTGTERVLAAAAKGDLHDRALWTAIPKLLDGAGALPALVGTPETVAAALLDYYDIGVTSFLLSGYDRYENAVAFGRELIPIVRDEVRRRVTQTASARG